ncbi:ArnT family glycosyltransferase [Amycolatopsis sp. cmx-8-4]|uniref:ArnT family glycosyltransferase n=1 Tax=Amycolatopsis sp. cmx-8-4 TaxID=2790947 RepID=UPI00397E6F70
MVTVQTRPPATTVAFARGPVLAIAGLAGLALLLTSGRYAGGFDELYFLVAGRNHLSWGYFDQPPLIPALAAAMDWIAPDSLVVLRLPMTLAAAAGVLVTALIAREFGGGRGAQAMAAACYATSGIVIVSHWIGTYVLDPFLWTVVAWLLVRWTRTRRDGLLVWAGVVTAVSLETKFLIPALWAAVLLAALVVGPRDLPRRPKLWLGAAIAAVVTVPTLIWQAAHGWPYTHMSEVVAAEFPGYGPWVRDGLLGAGIGVGVVALLYGVWRLLRSAELRPYRYLGVALILVALAVVATQGRSYYLMGCYAVPFAAAATDLTRRNLVRWWKVVAWPVFVLSAVVTLVALPVWPASARTSVGPFSLGSSFAQGELPQQELAKLIGQTYAALPPATRARTAVYAEIYPFAAVTEFYGAPYGIHTVYSGHRAYWYFGPPPESADTVLFAGFDPGLLRPHFAHETQVVDGLLWRYDGRNAPWSRIWPQLNRQ